MAVRVRDRAGNIGASQTISQAIKGEAQTQGGCQMAGGEARGLSVWLWALALLALLRRGRAKRGNRIRDRPLAAQAQRTLHHLGDPLPRSHLEGHLDHVGVDFTVDHREGRGWIILIDRCPAG